MTKKAAPLKSKSIRKKRSARPTKKASVVADAALAGLRASMQIVPSKAKAPFRTLPDEIQQSVRTLKTAERSFHGSKFSLAYFPASIVAKPCADMFGYMSSPAIRNATKLPFDANSQGLLEELGNLMADSNREAPESSSIPAGFTYLGQFVDHDITNDVSSKLEVAMDANTVHNMRTPSLDLDSLYGAGPALEPYLYSFPSVGSPSAIKLQLGRNIDTGAGGPAGSVGNPSGMEVQVDFDVPRMSTAANTAIIGDPRNDENLIVSQFHHAMIRFHNAVIDHLATIGFVGDFFVEAKQRVTHHYQWAIVHDFLKRICGDAIVAEAMTKVKANVDSPFRMPVEFSVAAYRFGHSMIRDDYWLSFAQPGATLGDVFAFNRNPNLPVFSNWVVDFNAFFDTGIFVPVHNKARKIDSVLATGLESLPGFTGMMAILAARNLRRGLALGLPSGQGMAKHFGLTPMTEAQLKQNLPADEVAILEKQNKLLLKKTPLWYYVLREAAVLGKDDALGPVGARIVAYTFVRILKRDAGSYLNTTGFGLSLPRANASDFTFADLIIFSGVNQP
jgi:hypothetical protein